MGTINSILLLGITGPAETFARQHFAEAGHRVVSACLSSLGEALKDPTIDVVYLQPSNQATALDELKRVRELSVERPVVLVLAEPSAQLTREAWHAGAVDVVYLPLTLDALNTSLQRASERPPARKLQMSAEVQARFQYLDESGNEHWSPIIPPRFTIGRSTNNDLALSHLSVSRSHAEILVEDGEYLLRDLGSKHGTFLNGARVQEARLKHGDRVELGGTYGQTLTFHRGDLLQSLLGITDTKPEISLRARDFREIGMLLATFRALSSIPLLDDLLALVVDTAIELTAAERGFIMLRDQSGDLSFRCARNSYKRSLDDSSFQTSRRVPEEVFKTGKRIMISNLDLDETPGDHSSTRRLGLRSIYCVPLRYLAFHDANSRLSGIRRMETLGALYVDSRSAGAGLSHTQLDALETLASEAAMAIYNARLYKDSMEKRKLDEELAIAREIQQALLPAPKKILPFACACSQNIPCREVGGDYFDYFDLPEGRLGFTLGDVAGKGIPAALLMTMIQGVFSAQATLHLPLSEMIANVNRYLVGRSPGNRFVTLFFGILDPGGNCTYTNAGHNPPLLVGKDGSMRELTEGGMVLGVFPGAPYESTTIRLEPGDHLVLFTDGVLEARNTKGEDFGEERLRTLLQENASSSPHEILTRTLDAIAAFSAEAPQHDDITMMVLAFGENR